MTSLVLYKVRTGGVVKLMRGPLVRKEIRGGVGVLKLERVQVICPACGQQVKAVATDGRVKGYCAVAKQHVDFLIETQRVGVGKDNTAEAKISAINYRQTPEYRAKQSAAHKGRHPTAETRAKISSAIKKRWQNPDFRAKQSATAKKRWQDPEYQAKVSQAIRQAMKKHRKS